MQSKNYTSLAVVIEELVKGHVYQSYPRNWDESSMTRSLFKSFQDNLNDSMITGFKKTLMTRWDAFKCRGSGEQTFCDAAIIVKVNHKDQPPIEGVALLEARKRTMNKAAFDGMGWKQMGKVFRNSHFAQLLLFDYEDIGSFSSNVILRMPPFGYGSLRDRILVSPYTFAAVTPINTAFSRKLNDLSLYRFALPFSQQLVMRYLHGFDLDFSNKAISVAKGDPNPLGSPRTLLCMNVAEENTTDVRQIELNNRVWEPLR